MAHGGWGPRRLATAINSGGAAANTQHPMFERGRNPRAQPSQEEEPRLCRGRLGNTDTRVGKCTDPGEEVGTGSKPTSLVGRGRSTPKPIDHLLSGPVPLT